jgi:hypothetical protein
MIFPVTRPLQFDHLRSTDLTVDEVYVGGSAGNASDDPLAVLLPVGNQGGFRPAGSPSRGAVKLVALYTSGHNEDWPDNLDVATGTFTYYGDNRKPGKQLHDTSRRGNAILRDVFALAHADRDARGKVPPFLLFERAVADARAVKFRGLLLPGSPLMPDDTELVAIWRSKAGQRFQNYRATSQSST